MEPASNRQWRWALGFLVAVALVAGAAPALANFSTGANRPFYQDQNLGSYTLSAPSSLSCIWTQGSNTSMDLSWTLGSSWGTSEVQRQDNSGGFSDYSSVGAGTSTYTDASATNPSTHTYDYKVNQRSGTNWSTSYTSTVTSTGCGDTISTLFTAGSGVSKLSAPADVAVDSSGNVYIADTANNEIRKFVPSTNTLTTYAGTGVAGHADNASATSATFNAPEGLAVASNGDLYVADTGNHVVRKIVAGGGQTSIFAGTSQTVCTTQGSGCGDAGAATSATLSSPSDVAIDPSGNVYVSDTGDNRVRKITGGNIINYAGKANSSSGNSGDAGVATNAGLNAPKHIAFDSLGDLFIADTGNNKIRQVFVTSGRAGSIAADYGGANPVNLDIYTIAGYATGSAGYTGDTTAAYGNGSSAKLNAPNGIAVDSSGNLYIGDTSNNVIRFVSVNTATHFGVSMTANNIYTIAGVNTITGYSGQGFPANITTGTAASTASGRAANVDTPKGLDVSSGGIPYFTDTTQNIVRSLTTDSTPLVVTVAGVHGSAGNVDAAGPPSNPSWTWELNKPARFVTDGSNNIFIADMGDNRIREYVAATGSLATIAGTGTSGDYTASVAATASKLKNPQGVAVNGNTVYVADTGNNRIEKFTNPMAGNTNTDMTLVAGTSTTACAASPCGDGAAATSASLSSPDDVAVLGSAVFIADQNDDVVRYIAATTATHYGVSMTAGNIYTIAGQERNACSSGSCGDGGAATSGKLWLPTGIDVDSSGNVYIADPFTETIRLLYTSGSNKYGQTMSANNIYLLTGVYFTTGSTGDTGAASSAKINFPYDVAVDSSGNYVVSDEGNAKVRRVTNSGSFVINTIAGTGSQGYATTNDGGGASGATINTVMGVAFDSSGNVFLGHNVTSGPIRKVLQPFH